MPSGKRSSDTTQREGVGRPQTALEEKKGMRGGELSVDAVPRQPVSGVASHEKGRREREDNRLA